MSDAARSLSYQMTVRSELRFVSQPPVRIKSLALSQSDLCRQFRYGDASEWSPI
jgi:hypothetical protein